MTSQNSLTDQPSFFGKYQRHFTILCLACYQLLIVPWALIHFYAILTLNWNILTFIVIMSVLQFPFKKSETFIKFVKKYIQPTNYFKKFTRITEEQIDQHQKILYGYHPHSIYACSILLNMNREEPGIPDFTGLGSRFGFNVPILGLFLRLWGCSTVYKQNLKSFMRQGKNIGIVPGGYEQGTLTTPHEMRIYLKNRKGFIKYALRYGYTIRPVLCIGQNKAFQTLDYFKDVRMLLNRFKIPAAFFINKKYLCFIDPNIEMTTIIGKGIRKENADPNYEPSVEDINHYHELYVQQVIRIYNKYKHLNDNKPLVIL